MEHEIYNSDNYCDSYPNFFNTIDEKYCSVPQGWRSLFSSFLKEADEYVKNSGKDINFKILQVKQKWFKFVIYYSGADEYLINLVRDTERSAENYCLSCGVILDRNVEEVKRGKCSGCNNDRR